MNEDLTDTEHKILDAARNVFLKRGKDGARMQHIADEANINKALLHYYFRSKDRLFVEVFSREIKEVIRNISEYVVAEKNFKKFLKIFIDQYMTNIYKRITLIRFILWESSRANFNPGDIIMNAFKSQGFPEIPLISRVRQEVQSGEIRKIDPEQFTINIISMCIFPFLAYPVISKIMTVEKMDTAEFLESRKSEVFDLVWNSVQPNKKNK